MHEKTKLICAFACGKQTQIVNGAYHPNSAGHTHCENIIALLNGR